MSNPVLPLQLWPALSKNNAARVIKLVSPKSGWHDHCCLREAEESVQWIKNKIAATQPPGQRKKALQRAAKKIDAAIKSIEALPIATQDEIDPKALHQLRDRIDALAEKITVPRSGGKKTGQGNLIDAAKKRAAADCAESMIEHWGSKPRASANHRKLTALLFKLATGKVGDVELACRVPRGPRSLGIAMRFYEEDID